jgi:hypothetical protein
MVLGQSKASGILDARDSLFRPMGEGTILGFQTSEVVCLDCGYVGTCLSEGQRSELEKKLRKA